MEERKTQTTFSLKQNCKNKLKSMFAALRQQNKGKKVTSYILILDDMSKSIISSYLKMSELLSEDIIAFDQIDMERQAYPKQQVIYFLTPRHSSIEYLSKDYHDKKNCKYGIAHIFFTNKLGYDLMQKISSNSVLVDHIGTMKEFNQDFICKFDNLFTFDMPKALPTLFSEQGQEYHNTCELVASKLATVVSSFEKFSGWEIIYNKNENKISEDIAGKVKLQLEELVGDLQKQNSELLDIKAGKITLIILDRSFDPLSPVVRDYYYQPMIYDLLDIKNDVVEYPTEEESKSVEPKKKKAILSDNDDLFFRYRFKHIAETLEGVPVEFQQFVSNNNTAKVQRGELREISLEQMSEIIKKMPQYQDLLQKYTMHVQLIDMCQKIFEDKHLADIGELEQTLVTGLDESGKQFTSQKILPKIASHLNSEKLNIYDKARMVLICIMCIELGEKERRELTKDLDANLQMAIANLIWLGVSAQSEKKSKAKKKVNKETMKRAKDKLSNATLNLARTTTQVELLLESLLTDNNVEDKFKSIPDRFKSLTVNGVPDFDKKKDSKPLKKNKLLNMIGGIEDESELSVSVPKVVVFIAGGIGYNEIRSLRNLPMLQTQNFCTIIGGTSLMKPNDYVDGLKDMKSN